MTAELPSSLIEPIVPADPPAPPTRFARCLQRCTTSGLRLVVTAPADTRACGPALAAFPQRRVDPAEHAQWETGYRLFCGRARQPHERGSWRILAADRDRRVVGAITARLFCREAIGEYLHATTLLTQAGPVFREHCELAVGEAFAAAQAAGRTPGEVSHWSVEPGRRAPVVALALARALGALAAAFPAPVLVLAADHRRGEVARLMRLGAAPLGRAGKFSLPPFVHQPTGAWLRFLLLDAPVFHRRSRAEPTADLELLREHVPVVSAV